MKSHKVYPNKGDSRLIVCFKGSHYISPFETQVGKGQRVPVTVGEQPDTVIVAGNEVWSLKGAYTDGSPVRLKGRRKKRAKAKKTEFKGFHTVAKKFRPDTVRVSPAVHQSVLGRIREVAPNESAAYTLEVCWVNWLNGCTRLSLFQGINYQDKQATAAVHQLGQELMKEFRQTVQS